MPRAKVPSSLSMRSAFCSGTNTLSTSCLPYGKRVGKYGAFATGITQNADDLLQGRTARTMPANSEFIIMPNQASADGTELARLSNISDLRLSRITDAEAGHGLIKAGDSPAPFGDRFPANTRLYRLMTTKPCESI